MGVDSGAEMRPRRALNMTPVIPEPWIFICSIIETF